MRGCLTLPFRLLLLALLVAAGILFWANHDAIRRRVHSWTAEPAPTAAEGHAEPGRIAEARRKVSALAAGRDSVVLTATEVASLVYGEANQRVPRSVDSVQVRLGRDEVEVRALVDTRPLKLGIASPVLRDHEWVEIGGHLIYRRAGIAEWEVGRARVRGVPVPRSVVQSLLRQLSGTASTGAAEVPLPVSVTGLRTGESGVVLYGGGRGS
jgi:hypothetical protein